MKPMGRIVLGVTMLAAGAALGAEGATCAHDATAVGMNARVNTMRDQMDRIEVTADHGEQRRLMELHMKHVREGLHELRKRDNIPVACRLEMMNAMLETMARHEEVAQELQER